MKMLADLHLIRPDWLWALVPTALILVLLRRQQDVAASWRGVIAPHLLDHLFVRPKERTKLRPIHLFGIAMLLAVLMAAGPSWRREPPPFTVDTAPLILALDLSRSMLVKDVQPSRLERAQQKARDILDTRQGARTGLLVYAGTAHLVLPLTDDPSVLDTYVTALEASVMPVPGKDSAAALRLAQRMLADEQTPGTMLFLTGGIEPAAVETFESFSREQRDQIAVLAVATAGGGAVPFENGRTGEIDRLDRATLVELERRAGAYVTSFTVDDTDVQRVSRQIASHLTAVQREDSEGRWRDEGWWLVFPLAATTLLWFRKGFTLRWET